MSIFKDGKLRFSIKVSFVFCIFVSILLITFTQKQYYSYKRERCQLLCQTAANQFLSDINKNVVVNQIIESMLLETNGNLSKFDKISEHLINNLPAIDCIQLAPKGTVTKSYPYSVYDGIGTNLFEAPDTKIASSYSLKTKNPYLTGPVSYNSGKSVIIIQHPVFLPDGIGGQKFWGFSVLHLKLSNLFSEETLQFLNDSGYAYCLWKPDPQTSDVTNLARNTAHEISNPCETVFKVSNSLWTLYTAPMEGWRNTKLLATEIIIAVIISASISLLIAFLISLKDRDEALEKLSYRDTLTNLFNARKFMTTLKEFQKINKPYSLIYMDLNDFKLINDNLGHETGDQVLVIAGRKLANCIREGDLAFRIGGDEFAVILPGAHDPIFVEDVIIRIKESIGRETVLKNARLSIVTSAGYARKPEDGSDFDEIIKIADNGMYEDKRKIKAAKKAEEAVNRK